MHQTLLLDWLTVCKSKPERELQTWKWRALLFGWPWGFGVVWAAANRTLITPYEVLNTPNWWCYNAFGEPGTIAFKVTTIAAMITLINTFLLLSACMISLIRVRTSHDFECIAIDDMSLLIVKIFELHRLVCE